MKTTKRTEKPHDEVLAEVRRHKLEIAAAHNFDVRRLTEDLQRRQKGHPRLVSPPAKRSEQDQTDKPATPAESKKK